uniref:LITAF domain-containing protein n=1 Tax=Clastoptera arizonana TaxID=38151 RepID=A0A1B6CZB9_9HEMI
MSKMPNNDDKPLLPTAPPSLQNDWISSYEPQGPNQFYPAVTNIAQNQYVAVAQDIPYQQAPQMQVPPAYPHQQPQLMQQPTMQVVNQQVVNVGPHQCQMTCPNCQTFIKTSTTTESTGSAYICCCLMFITGLCCICSCLPFCMNSFKVVNHSCPNCKAFLGSYRR